MSGKTARAIAISLKIPDNTAYTALVALRRLGIDADRVERSEIRFFEDEGDVATLIARIKSDETIFNPNKHRLTVLETNAPRSGETWIEESGPSAGPRRYVGWRLFNANGDPVTQEVLDAAIDRLLCNPAIETAIW